MEKAQIQKAVERINDKVEMAVFAFYMNDKKGELQNIRIAKELAKMLVEDFGISLRLETKRISCKHAEGYATYYRYDD